MSKREDEIHEIHIDRDQESNADSEIKKIEDEYAKKGIYLTRKGRNELKKIIMERNAKNAIS